MNDNSEPIRMLPRAANERVTRELASWRGVTTHPGPTRGGVEFRSNGRVLGHLHALSGIAATADLILPPALGAHLIGEGRARAHAIVPMPGWVTVPMGTEDQVTEAIALFRDAYDRSIAARLTA